MAQSTFYGRPLLAPPGRVMRPRPASEQLVATALAFLSGKAATVADVGTGSGALAVAIAGAAPAARVWATDTSPDAIAVARANVAALGLERRVEVRLGDLLDPVPGPIDLVVANLPYLPAADAWRFPELADEPAEAAFAAGDGLDPYRRLIEACEQRLADGGAVAIQLHRRVLAARRDELALLRAEIEAASAVAGRSLLEQVERVLQPILHP
jgi:release factor glutamine methyltransferase